MENLAGYSAHQIAAGVRSRAFSRVEVVESHLAVIRRANPEVGALVVERADGALAEAAAADHAGADRGDLDGVPISVKAEYDVAGLPTSHGNSHFSSATAGSDSPVVERLRARGAIVMGKGNQPDFAMRWNTFSSEGGWTRNPRDLSASAGGSSGGDAAAVAAGMVAIGFGTDLAGSIRVPAAFCGVYGLRSTPGRIPFASEDPLAVRSPAVEAFSSQGPFARSVADLELAFSATAGPSTRHPFSSTARRHESAARPMSRRVARVVDAAGAQVSAEMTAQVDLVCASLEEAGYEIEETSFEGIDRAPNLWGELVSTDLRVNALPHLAPLMDPSCLDHIEKLSTQWPTARQTDQYLTLWTEWARLRRAVLRWLASYPLVISPVSGFPGAPALQYDHWVSSPDLLAITARMRNCLWVSCMGLPSLALPNGVQLIAAPHQDESLFSPAAIAEEALPPCLPALVSAA
ncbi:amidase [Microbacterium hydrocarbonoxydans]|uniref:amidase n=1 Tax=Microbacterium hydrocarbonoxydans TaxID=273678 RepID=UPI003D973547